MRRTAVLLAGCLLLVGGAALAGASAPPSPVCSVCGSELADAVDRDVTVEESTATVQVHEDGSATWTVRNWLASADDAERVASDPALRETGYGPMSDAELRESSVEDRTVVARYTDPTFADLAAGGALATGVFTRDHGYPSTFGLGADRLTVVAPEGARVGWTPPGASVSDDGRRLTLTELDENGFAVFVPADRPLGTVAGLAAVAGIVLPTFAANALAMVPLQAGVFGLLAAMFGGLVRPSAAAGRSRAFASVAAGVLGAGSLVLGVVATTVGAGLAPIGWWATGAGLGGVTLAVALRRRPPRDVDVRWLAGIVAGGVAVAALGALALGAALGLAEPLRALPAAVGAAALLGFAPAGYAAARGRRALGAAVAWLSLAVALLAVVPLGTPHFGPLILLPFGLSSAGVFALAGGPFLLVGAMLGEPRPSERAGDAGRATERSSAAPE